MITVTNKLFVKKELHEEFEGYILKRMDFMEGVDGLISHDFRRPYVNKMGTPDYYVLVSTWKSEEDLRSWMRTDKFHQTHQKLEKAVDFYFQENEIFMHESVA